MNLKKEIQEIFEKYNVNNKELENAMIKLFSKFENHMLSDSMIRKIDEKLQKLNDRGKKALGG